VSELLVIVALVAIILVHELGHLLAARACGIRATTFSFGFGRAIWERQWRGVNWRWSLIPLGGYVRIPAIMPPDLEADKRALLDGQDALSEADSERIALTASSAELYEALSREPELPNGEWERIRDEHAPDTYHLASWAKRTVVILAGSAVNVLGGAVLLWLALLVYSPLYSTEWKVSSVSGSASKTLVGQRVLQLNDEGLTRSDSRVERDLDSQARANPGKSLLLLEGGHVVALDPGTATISQTKSTLIGRRSDVSAAEALDGTVNAVKLIVTGTARVAVKAFVDEKVRKETGTVVGAVQQAPQARDYLPQYVLVLSIAIGLVNLLPLLPLDGGHFVMSTLRALRVPLRRTAYYSFGAAGFAFVIALFLIGLGNDIRAF
jgi:regulator of sigma E protease